MIMAGRPLNRHTIHSYNPPPVFDSRYTILACAMKLFLSILSGLFLCVTANSQVIFKTIAPQKPVVAGEPFIVQYVMEETGITDLSVADFSPFRLINGPNEYDANNGKPPPGHRRLKNFVYTIAGNAPGLYTLPQATARYHGRWIYSNPVTIDVISQEAARVLQRRQDDGSSLLPGEDPYRKMKENIFLQVKVDRKSCFVGEPVIATFKLYSALRSHADIIKNPAFYGFTALDMINLSHAVSSTEQVNGKPFTVHTVRQVQLYPIQAGSFSIDPMEVLNKVSFSGKELPGKEVTEGILEEGTGASDANEYESRISSETVRIEVKPLPLPGRPHDFEGATGRFTITAALQHDKIARNEEGVLVITIRGQGNFTQIALPAVQWPQGLEGFDSSVTDQLNKMAVPISGSRSFRYAFIPAGTSNYTIPPVRFSFFDTDSNRYRTISTAPLSVTVENRDKAIASLKPVGGQGAKGRSWWLFTSILGVLTFTIAAILLRHRKEKNNADQQELKKAPTLAEFLEPAAAAMSTAPASSFYSHLRKGIFDFLGDHFQRAGSAATKQSLLDLLAAHNVPAAGIRQLALIIEECEAGIFTQAEMGTDKELLLENTKSLLRDIQASTSG